jgi:hypothetical protein
MPETTSTATHSISITSRRYEPMSTSAPLSDVTFLAEE